MKKIDSMNFLEHLALLWKNALELILEAIPFLGIGFFIAGILHISVSSNLIARYLRKESIVTSIKAAVLGAPLPLCSCSVIPVATELRHNGASKGALTSFLISGPETGIDSLFISYVILGPFMTITRLLSTLCTAIITSCLVMVATFKMPLESVKEKQNPCCRACTPSKNNDAKPISFFTRFIDGQRYAFTTLLDDSFKWVLLAIGATAVMNTYVPHDFFTQYGDGLPAMLVMAAIGFPMYICATASTPIAAGLLLSGISPGAILVFMLVGPASNITTIGVVKKLLHTRAAVVYVFSVIVISVAIGLFVNKLVTLYSWDILAEVRRIDTMPRSIAIIATAFVFLASIKKLRPYIGLGEKI